LAQVVAKSAVKLGIKVLVSSKAVKFEDRNGTLHVQVDTPEGEVRIEASNILVSIGKRPSFEGMALEAAGIRVNAKGLIEADDTGKTANARIFVIGDASGPPYLAHKASYQGIQTALRIANGKPSPPAPIPLAVFTDPEVASVGLSEAEARALGLKVLVGRFPFTASGRALASRDLDGLVKVTADASTRRVLGVGIAGPNASDLIGEACLALRMGATVEDVSATLHPHPTLPEAFLEASEAALGQAIHILQRTPSGSAGASA